MKNQAENQNLKTKIVIVGAGPAGTSLAIRLAKENFQVILIEREKFPRHKLCGEFISPECFEHFRELGILDEMLMLGGDRILQTVFYSENGRNVSVPSEWFNGNRQGALGLSRAEMDFRLMEKAKELGVEVLEECSVIGLLFENEKVCGVKIKNFEGETEEILSDLTIDATGRAKVLAKLSEKEISRKDAKTQRKIRENLRPKTKVQRQKLVGFKAHLKNVHLEKGRCEIYFFRGGYGGLNYVENGVANHCFLMKAEIIKEFKSDVEAILQNVIFQNTRAKETLKEAENLYDWLAVSVDGFGIKEINPAKNLLTVGDAAAFIDPFTGSGMLMAFESAKILAVVIAENQYSAEKIVEQYELLHKAKFQRRMQVCKIMRQLSFIPSFAKSAISVLSLSKRFRETLVRLTRKAGTEKGI
ncbi:MAG: NAD(P)/FAD-dependent oxidoreductase [Acidobacteriota bacterium]|nr:NAD(P)/FAD-dependent oxidoreductase [Acidobacteriota bacterium]